MIDGATRQIVAQLQPAPAIDLDVALDSAARRLYAVVGGRSSLFVFDMETNTQLAELTLSSDPRVGSLETNASNGRVYLGRTNPSAVEVFDGVSGSLLFTDTLPSQYRPFGIVVDAANERFYVDVNVFDFPDDPPECASFDGATVLLDGSGSTDADSSPGTNDDIVAFEWFEDFGLPEEMPLGSGEQLPVVFSLGSHTITLRVTDSDGQSATDDAVVTIVDTTPPELTVDSSPALLWPPNHRLVDVVVRATAIDVCGQPSVLLTSATSNEPDNGLGDGDTAGDIQDAEIGTADFEMRLRAERSALGSGRVYTVTYSAADGSGFRLRRSCRYHKTAVTGASKSWFENRARPACGGASPEIPARRGPRSASTDAANKTAAGRTEVRRGSPPRRLPPAPAEVSKLTAELEPDDHVLLGSRCTACTSKRARTPASHQRVHRDDERIQVADDAMLRWIFSHQVRSCRGRASIDSLTTAVVRARQVGCS